jgi:hypothetical protein
MENTFSIDFFELSFLAEACVPPVPIARNCFWKNLTDRYWYLMDDKQRSQFHQWISQNEHYKKGLEKGDREILIFEHRFNPEYQYRVISAGTTYLTFLFEGEHYLANNRYLNKETITSVTKRDIHDTSEV